MSCDQGLITKKCLATHANLSFDFELPSNYKGF